MSSLKCWFHPTHKSHKFNPNMDPDLQPSCCEFKCPQSNTSPVRDTAVQKESRRSSNSRTRLSQERVKAATALITGPWRGALLPAGTEPETRTSPPGFWSWACGIQWWWWTETSLWSQVGTVRRRGPTESTRRRKARSRRNSTPAGKKRTKKMKGRYDVDHLAGSHDGGCPIVLIPDIINRLYRYKNVMSNLWESI